MNGKYVNYKNALKVLRLDTLAQRRRDLCLKFAQNCLKNDKVKDLFPKSERNYNIKTRKREKFIVTHAKTERYLKSAVPYMQRLLNNEYRNKMN